MTELLLITLLAWLGAMAAIGCGLLIYGTVTVIRVLMKG